MNNFILRLKRNKYIVILLIIFGVIYSLTSLVNHYNFRTYGADLGYYTNALYDYIHFQWNDSSTFKLIDENLLADHFDIYLILFSPLSLLFGSYTLLFVQIFAVLLGGIGVYYYLNSKTQLNQLAILGMLYFYSFYGVFGAISYDYHSNVIAAAIVPWFFYFVHRQKLLKASLLLLFIIISKENISLWISFICLGLTIEYRKQPFLRNYLLISALLSGIYFITIISIVMPAISNNGISGQFKYDVLGRSPSEAIIHLLTNPIDSFKNLFLNHTNSQFGDFVKLELHLILLFAGLPFLIWKPRYLLMLIPIYFQKLFHNNYSMWGINDQYNIEFAPILAIGIFVVISDIKRANLRKSLAITAVCLAIATTVKTMDNTVKWTDKSKIRFYQLKHYKKDYDVRAAHQEILKIPRNTIVSAQGPFMPHVAYRDNLYQFPIIKDAEYIIFSENEKYFVTSEEEFNHKTDSLKSSSNWDIIFNKGVTILKRK